MCENRSAGSSKVLRHSSFGHQYFLNVTRSISRSAMLSEAVPPLTAESSKAEVIAIAFFSLSPVLVPDTPEEDS
jgi:hypothetical protein